MRYKYVFWDWNGTLFDDAEAAWLAVNAMLDNRNTPHISFERYRDTVDVPIRKFYETVMDMSKETMQGLSDEFTFLWNERLPSSPLSNGALELLDALHQNGVKQYIYSSSHKKMILPYIERFGLGKYFEDILGATDFNVGSKAERTRDYIIANRINPNETVFIGDMDHDSDVASFVGSDCILVSCGHQCEEKLTKTGRTVVKSLPEISKMIINP